MPDSTALAACKLDPARVFKMTGREAYPWQRHVLNTSKNFILNVHRTGGKTAVSGYKCNHTAIFKPGSLSVCISRTKTQAQEVIRKAMAAYAAMKSPIPTRRESTTGVEYTNASRIISLPAKEASTRGFSADREVAVDLLIIDEASRVPEDVIASVEPMMARGGQMGMLSTPRGQHGTFYKRFTTNSKPSPWEPGKPAMWEDDGWLKIAVPWTECPHISPAFINSQRLLRGDDYVAQEYENSFTRVSGQVYGDLFKPEHGVFVDTLPEITGLKGGGLDFGWRDPFAACWGWWDTERDILWVVGEHKRTQGLLAEHAAVLKRWEAEYWIADTRGAQEIAELRAANVPVRKALFNKDIDAGIAAVNARIRTNRLKILKPRCPKLVEEARLYSYEEDEEGVDTDATRGEKPEDSYNHLLDALRYWVTFVDRRFVAAYRKRQPDAPAQPPEPLEFQQELRKPKWPWEMDAKARAQWEVAAVNDARLWTGEDDED